MTQLVEFGKHEFRLNKLGSDKVSLRDTCAVVERRTGVMPEEGVNPFELPPVCEQVWKWFLQLSRERLSDMGGTHHLTSAGILAFFTLEGFRPEPWEILAIRLLDDVAMASIAEKPE